LFLDGNTTDCQIISSLYSGSRGGSRDKDIEIDISIQNYPVDSPNPLRNIYIRKNIYNPEKKISKNLFQSIKTDKFEIVEIFLGEKLYRYNQILLNIKDCLDS